MAGAHMLDCKALHINVMRLRPGIWAPCPFYIIKKSAPLDTIPLIFIIRKQGTLLEPPVKSRMGVCGGYFIYDAGLSDPYSERGNKRWVKAV